MTPPPPVAADRDLLRAFRKHRTPEHLSPILERYVRVVHAQALRLTSSSTVANDVTRAVFLALARRPPSRLRRTSVADWLFETTRLATRKAPRQQKPAAPALPGNSDPWPQIAPRLDRALARLPRKLRDAVLVSGLVGFTPAEGAAVLRLKETRFQKQLTTGLRKLGRRLRKQGFPPDPEAAAALLLRHGQSAEMDLTLTDSILSALPLGSVRGEEFRLLRRTLGTLTWAKWKRRFRAVLAGVGLVVVLLAMLALAGMWAWQSGHLIGWMLEFSNRRQAKEHPELVQPAKPWTPTTGAPLSAAAVRSAEDLFRITNVWTAHLKFSAEAWKAVEPKRIPPLPNAMQSDGTFLLKNPKARRSGLAGVIGFDFEYAKADLEFGGQMFPDVAARIKGNGTFLGSLWGLKRSFKVDLNKHHKDQDLGGVDMINFSNLIEDRSYMADALAYEFFRDVGVPAPRTAYAYLSLTAGEEIKRRPLGLYVMVENLDRDFAKHWFGTKDAPIFKPVTYHLFKDLGAEWTAYAPIYDLKTKATPAQEQRVIEFARLLTNADDAAFAREVGQFLDLDEFARFLGALSLISSYDGFLSNGQNFYLYLDPRSNKFGFIPWDLDHAWGNFPFVGTAETRERASLFRPWVGEHRLLERVTATEEFQKIYRARLEDMLTTFFVPDRLNRRIDEVAAAIRSTVAAESDLRLSRFDQAVSEKNLARWEGDPFDPTRTAHQLKRFIHARAKNAREQLDGRTKGLLLERQPPQ